MRAREAAAAGRSVGLDTESIPLVDGVVTGASGAAPPVPTTISAGDLAGWTVDPPPPPRVTGWSPGEVDGDLAGWDVDPPQPPRPATATRPLLPAASGVAGPSEPAEGGGSVEVDFRTAAIRLSRTPPQTAEAVEAARQAAHALVHLAAKEDEVALRHYLRPDPEQAEATWTVACYQIGDLTPCALMDYASPVDAVTALVNCGDASHLAAELVASTASGIRWTAMNRTGAQLSFQLPDDRSATELGADAGLGPVMSVERWRRQLDRWSTPLADPAPHPGPRPPRGRKSPTSPPVSKASVELERALELVVATLHRVEATARSVDEPDARVLGRLDALDRRLSEFQVAFEAALDRRIHALARYTADLTRALTAQQQAVNSRLEARLDDLVARLPPPPGLAPGDAPDAPPPP